MTASAAAVRRADDRAALARRQLGAFLGCARAASGAIRVDAAALCVGLGGRLAAGYEESKVAGAQSHWDGVPGLVLGGGQVFRQK